MLTDKIIHELHIDWAKIDKHSYLRTIPSIQNLTHLEFPKNITFFVGENGSGKSTMAEEYDCYYNGKPLHGQSHGESFLSFFEEYNGKGLYIMDEPEAALFPQRQLSLLIHIAKMAEAGSQFIIVTHSPILLRIPGADIISFDDGHIHRCTYEETESYQVTKMFLMHREKMLEGLLGE